MRITSPAFEHGGMIPRKHTCEGDDVAPPLRIDDVPDGAESLVLIMEDPDVPKKARADGTWDHWIVYNIPAKAQESQEGEAPPGERGRGTNGKPSYSGPCPPDREHRYFINLYALDSRLLLAKDPTKADVIAAMEGHVIARAELMGRYGPHGSSSPREVAGF